MKSGNKTTGFQTSNVLLITFTHFLHDVYSSFISPILPLLIKKFSLSYSLASLFPLMQNIPALFNPFIGILSDKIRMRYLVIFAPAVTAVCMSLVGVADNYIFLIILIIVAGTSSAFFHVPTPVMMRKVSGKYMGRGMSFYMLGGEMARTIGPIVILGAVSLWGLEGTYRLIPFGLITTGFLYFRLKNLEISKDVSKDKSQLTGIKTTLKNHSRFFIILSGYLFTRALLKSSLTAFLPTYLNMEKGESLWFSGISLSVLQFAAAAGTLITGTLSDKLGRKTLLLVIAIVSPFIMLLFLNTSNDYLMFTYLVLLGLFHFSTGPVLLALVQDQNSERPAFLNSVFMTIAFTIGSVTVFLTGLLSDYIGLEQTYHISVWVAFGSVPFVLMLKGKVKGLPASAETSSGEKC